MTYRCVELFSGAGLLGQGFAQAGFKAVYAADLDENAIASYNNNMKHKVGAVRSVADVHRDAQCDLLLAGPPCQGFSTLGKRDKKDARNKLSLLLLDWAKSSKAKVIVIENVPQFLESTYHVYLKKAFANLRYRHTAWILDAYDFGVAQHRHRSFTVFSNIGLPSAPIPSRARLTVKDAFSGLGTRANNDGMHSSPSPTLLALERMKAIPRNGGKMDLMRMAPHLCPKSWFELGTQAVDVWGRLNYEKPSNTVRCCFSNPSKGRYIHPTQNRVITLREGARLQGIPDSWQFTGSRTAIARQIGNGVPVPLAAAVAKSVRDLF